MKKAILGKKLGMTQKFLPDGRLLAVERSLAFSLSGLFQTRIYAVGFAGATDVSAVAALSGASDFASPAGLMNDPTVSLT